MAGWVTIKGRRVFIEDGETPTQAIERSKKEHTKKVVSGGNKIERLKSDAEKAYNELKHADNVHDDVFKAQSKLWNTLHKKYGKEIAKEFKAMGKPTHYFKEQGLGLQSRTVKVATNEYLFRIHDRIKKDSQYKNAVKAEADAVKEVHRLYRNLRRKYQAYSKAGGKKVDKWYRRQYDIDDE